MDEALKFEKVTTRLLPTEVSFTLAAGSVSAVVNSRQEESDEQVRLMLGIAAPASGIIAVFGESPLAIERNVAPLPGRVAVVFPSGGLVSNLKVWENLVLPAEYHGTFEADRIEEKAMEVLRRVGYSGSVMELPAHLSLYRKRQVGIARAMLSDPRLIVYNGILSGLNDSERSVLIAAALAFHKERQERTSLFLTSNAETIKGIGLDRHIVM